MRKLIAFATLILFIVSFNAYSITRYVGGGGTPNYDDLQSAIDASNNGDVINVASGTYTTTSELTIDKEVTINGAKAGVSPVNNPARDRSTGESVLYLPDGISLLNQFISVEADNVVLNGLKILIMNNGCDACSLEAATDVQIRNCVFDLYHDDNDYFRAINVGWNCNDAQIVDNYISITVGFAEQFVYGITSDSRCNIDGNEVFLYCYEWWGRAFLGAGIIIDGDGGGWTDNSTINDNTIQGFATCIYFDGDGFSITNNTITEYGEYGLEIYGDDGDIQYNTFPDFTGVIDAFTPISISSGGFAGEISHNDFAVMAATIIYIENLTGSILYNNFTGAADLCLSIDESNGAAVNYNNFNGSYARAIYYEGGNALDATKNWWNEPLDADAHASIAIKITKNGAGDVFFSPWLYSGVDALPTVGFDPATPVHLACDPNASESLGDIFNRLPSGCYLRALTGTGNGDGTLAVPVSFTLIPEGGPLTIGYGGGLALLAGVQLTVRGGENVSMFSLSFSDGDSRLILADASSLIMTGNAALFWGDGWVATTGTGYVEADRSIVTNYFVGTADYRYMIGFFAAGHLRVRVEPYYGNNTASKCIWHIEDVDGTFSGDVWFFYPVGLAGKDFDTGDATIKYLSGGKWTSHDGAPHQTGPGGDGYYASIAEDVDHFSSWSVFGSIVIVPVLGEYGSAAFAGVLSLLGAWFILRKKFV